jgi:hypothetical protein
VATRPSSPAQAETTVRWPAPATLGREQRLAEVRAREVRARGDFARALARIERTYELAVRNLEAFDAYLGGVRQHLQRAGYLAPPSAAATH